MVSLRNGIDLHERHLTLAKTDAGVLNTPNAAPAPRVVVGVHLPRPHSVFGVSYFGQFGYEMVWARSGCPPVRPQDAPELTLGNRLAIESYAGALAAGIR